MARILLLSNGHGEDLSGSLIGQNLRELGHDVHSFPLVGNGSCYREAGIRIIGRTKTFSTGGIGYTSLVGRITELIQGQLFYLLWRLYQLQRVARKYDLFEPSLFLF